MTMKSWGRHAQWPAHGYKDLRKEMSGILDFRIDNYKQHNGARLAAGHVFPFLFDIYTSTAPRQKYRSGYSGRM